jgi:hypothetical protein
MDNNVDKRIVGTIELKAADFSLSNLSHMDVANKHFKEEFYNEN